MAGLFDQIDAEMSLQERLAQHGVDAFDGMTGTEARRDRFRAAIEAHGLAEVICGTHAGKPECYRERWARIYSAPWPAEAKRKRA